MARPRTFDEDLALDKAVKIFWAKGYEATSIQDLVDAMGLQRASLYATFGSKQQLFLRALKQYGHTVVDQLLEILESKPSGRESIILFFDQLVEHLITAGPLRSCLVTNAAIERGLTDEATRKQVYALLESIKNGFHQALSRAQENDEITTEMNLSATAYYLTSSMQGLLVMGKVCPDRTVLESINDVTLSVLK